MLIPLFLIDACGRSPTEMGWLMAPLGLGMLCTYPFIGSWTKTYGIRRISSVGALLALLGTLPFLYMPSHGADILVLAIALFIRGAGQSTVGIPSMSAAYASVDRAHLPMATTLLNVVQRLGGPILTTLSATLLASQLESQPPHPIGLGPYELAFLLLIAFHVLLVVAALRLPR
jgi:MFS family permease